ncbi:MAG: HhH-GPD family protein, partial [Dehalococcoidia bacterium]
MDQDPVAIRRVRRRLLRWGRRHYQHYAWRDETDPWLTLVAEFLLQRTRARQVEPAFHELRERYPTADTLADAGPDAARALLDRLGLFWRAPFLFQLATAVSEHGGQPPETLDELRLLTGVGLYTSAAWLSLHRGKRAVIIDSNVARLLSRLTGNPYPPDPRHVKWVQDLADLLTPRQAFRDYNYAILDFTMLVCTPRNPRCSICPLRPDCAYGQEAQARYSATP